MKTRLRAVEEPEPIHPRELARRIIKEKAEQLPGGVAEVHDVTRRGNPAPALPVDDAVRSATYQIKQKQVDDDLERE